MTGVRLVVGSGDDAVTMTLAGAWVDDDGSGHGVEARAEAPSLTVEGERSSWRLKDGVVVFEGAVRAVRADVTLLCDRLEVTYDGDRMREAHASGNVRVERGDRRGRADRGHLTIEDGRIVLEGSPELTDGPNRMTGTRITLFLDEERLECVGCRLVVEGGAVQPVTGPR